jgi:hypothetical protein
MAKSQNICYAVSCVFIHVDLFSRMHLPHTLEGDNHFCFRIVFGFLSVILTRFVTYCATIITVQDLELILHGLCFDLIE